MQEWFYRVSKHEIRSLFKLLHIHLLVVLFMYISINSLIYKQLPFFIFLWYEKDIFRDSFQCFTEVFRDRFRSGLLYIILVSIAWTVFLTGFGKATVQYWVPFNHLFVFPVIHQLIYPFIFLFSVLNGLVICSICFLSCQFRWSVGLTYLTAFAFFIFFL